MITRAFCCIGSRSSRAFQVMAERASPRVSSGEASVPQSVHYEAAGSEANSLQESSEALESLHIHRGNTEKSELQPFNHLSSSSPQAEQSRCSEAEAASASETNGRRFKRKDAKEVEKFQLKNACVLALQRGDITKWSIDGQMDGIVNAANSRMLGGGGVDGAIHRAAGRGLYEACLKLPLVAKGIRCQTGDAVITKAFRLPVSTIVHTVGPIYDDNETSGPLLESSYKNSLRLAVSHGVKYLAFPAISCGVYGYPYDEAAEIALNTVNEHSAGLKEVHFVLFEEASWTQWLSKACRSFERVE